MPSQETLPKAHVLLLKPILERERGRAFSDEEVECIARGLVNLYTKLADNKLGIGHIEEPEGSDNSNEDLQCLGDESDASK